MGFPPRGQFSPEMDAENHIANPPVIAEVKLHDR